MEVTITPVKLCGAVTPPPSKSQVHRMVLASMLSGGDGQIPGASLSQDILATQACVTALRGGTPAGEEGLPVLDCGESGSTLRFLLPVALALRGGGHFTGRGRLMERPLEPYFSIFREKGVSFWRTGDMLSVQGPLPSGEYRLRGDVSSQFVTGLLYALPLVDGDSEIVLTAPLESRDYVAMTLDVLERSGVTVEGRDYRHFYVPGGQRFRAPRGLVLEADWSQGAFWCAASFLGSQVTVEGLRLTSLQGDRRVIEYAKELRASGDVALDVSQCPDLAPPLAVMAAVRSGTVRIVNAARLRLKESDRLACVAQVLGALGAEVIEEPDSLTIRGRGSLSGGVTVDSHGDHRIAMMAAIAATCCEEPVTIVGAECVAKSYPDFWGDYEKLGGRIVRR